MNKCNNCSAPVNDTVSFCPSCGKKIEVINSDNGASSNSNAKFSTQDLNKKIQNINNTKDYTSEFDVDDIQANKGICILAYIYLLFLIPLLGAPKSKFARFHSNQGLLLFILNLIYNIPLTIIITIVDNIPFIGWISFIFNILRIIPAILMVLGIINAANGKAKELPFIGKFRIIN